MAFITVTVHSQSVQLPGVDAKLLGIVFIASTIAAATVVIIAACRACRPDGESAHRGQAHGGGARAPSHRCSSSGC